MMKINKFDVAFQCQVKHMKFFFHSNVLTMSVQRLRYPCILYEALKALTLSFLLSPTLL